MTTDGRSHVRRVIDEVSRALAAVEGYAPLRELFDDPDRRWFFSGQGRSGLVAQMAAMRFMHLGRRVHVIGEATAPSVRGSDGLLLISGSGRTPVSRSFARIAREEGAAVGVVTAHGSSPLAELADATTVVGAVDTVQFGGSLFEQSALLLLDALVLDLTAATPTAHADMAHRHTNLQ